MGLFSKKKQPLPPPAPLVFDGVRGADTLAQLTMTLLQRAGEGWTEPIGDVASTIFSAMPTDPSSRVGNDFFDSRWNWILAVAKRAESGGDLALAGRIGLMCEVWNRGVLREDPRYEAGRLTKVKFETEMDLYRCALRSLAQLKDDVTLVPASGDQGWSVSEAIGQISGTILDLKQAGDPIPAELLRMAEGDLEALGVKRIEARPMNLGDDEDPLDLIKRMTTKVDDAVRTAEAGDEASAAYLRAGYIVMNNGDPAAALAEFERAAQMGHVDSMSEAAGLLHREGQVDRAQFWWESAANAGHAGAAWNYAVVLLNSGGRSASRAWYQRCGELGDPRGYGALTQMARDDEDRPALLHWSYLGAEAGEPFCMFFYGVAVMQEEERTPSQLRDARDCPDFC